MVAPLPPVLFYPRDKVSAVYFSAIREKKESALVEGEVILTLCDGVQQLRLQRLGRCVRR